MAEEQKGGASEVLEKGAVAANAVKGAVKTGKAVANIAKGAAAGGPYGAIAGAIWENRKIIGKILIAATALLMIPVIFIMMLPSLIFGGLMDAFSPADPDNPIINSGTALLDSTTQIADAVDAILAEALANTVSQIQSDFDSSEANQIEVINPYATSMLFDANQLVSMYCASKGDDYASVSVDDLSQMLRSHMDLLYTYTVTEESKVVMTTDPETGESIPLTQTDPDTGEVTNVEEVWRIYRISFTGEAHFADQVFALTDDQKELAKNYASNLNLFMQDDKFAGTVNSAFARDTTIDISGYTDPSTKNNLDLVQWAIEAESRHWGYVWGTYTNSSAAYENLVPGDVIVFAKDSGSLAHVGIYAGAYDLYSYGNNLGLYHFLIHVGNSRGPEITIVEWMNSSGTDKDSSPIAWYHLDFNDIDEHGFIEVYKDDTDGAPLAGAYFTATDQATGTNYIIGPTSSEGYAISEPLPLSTYLVKESVFPDGFQASGETSWTVTLTKDTPNMTYPIYAVNELITGDLGIKKDTEDGLNKAGWLFNIYADQSCTILLRENLESDSNGNLTATGLVPGDVWVKEMGHKDPAINDLYQCGSDNPQKVTIIGNRTVSVTFRNNLRYGSITFRKATTSGVGVELGWTANLWKIESDGAKTFMGSGTTKQDKNDPTYTFEGLLPGKYLLQEDPSSAKYGYSLDATAYEVTVSAGQNTPVTITNESLGFIEILKETNTGKDVAGRKFNIFTDEARTQLLPGSPFESDSNGRFLTEAKPGVYFIQEVDESADNPGWIFDTTVHRVEVKAHETATVKFTNIQQGYGQIIKDMPDGGSGEGWAFDLHSASDNAYIATYTTGSDSTVNTDWLLPGEYLVYERISEDSLYYCESENPQRITIVAGEVTTVTFVNRLKPAKIEGLKTDTYGNPLPGSSFLLEWSEDGTTWQPVTYTDSPYVTRGTCTSVGLENGILTSGEDGIVSFTGLHPEMFYRMTEVSTVNGAQLMADTIFEGQIPTDDLAVAIEVVNNSVFVLPHTGSKSLVLMPVSIGLCLLICVGALLTLRKKEKSC